jgi:hypothetical protein
MFFRVLVIKIEWMKKKQIMSGIKGVGAKNFMIVFLFSTILSLSSSAQNVADNVGDSSFFYDSHFHLTNYVQQGIDIHKYIIATP